MHWLSDAMTTALSRLDAELDGASLDDTRLARCLLDSMDIMDAPLTIADLIEAVRHRAQWAGEPDPVGLSVRRVARLSDNTRRAYRRALARLDEALAGQSVDDMRMAQYLSEHLAAQGRSVATAATVVAAVGLRAKLSGEPSPIGVRTEAALSGMRARERASAPTALESRHGRGRTKPLTEMEFSRILHDIAQRKKGLASARRQGVMDAAIAAVLFRGGLRRGEAASLRWMDVAVDVARRDPVVELHLRQFEPAQPKDVRFLKNKAANALIELKNQVEGEENASPYVFGGLSGASINRRFVAAAKAAGIEGVTAQSGRVGLATELTARGATIGEVMSAGNWLTPYFVQHYGMTAGGDAQAALKYL